MLPFTYRCSKGTGRGLSSLRGATLLAGDGETFWANSGQVRAGRGRRLPAVGAFLCRCL